MVIEAVIFDFGRVLTISPFAELARFEVGRGRPTDITRISSSSN
jgi:hypothetical protein